MTLLASVPPAEAPRYLTRPPWTSSAGQEAVELAASAGLHLDPWEIDALEVGLAERKGGRWAANQVGLILPRQNGKGAVLEALELFWLYITKEDLVLHSAHEFKTASDHFRRLWSRIEDTPDLEHRVHKVHHAHGSEGIELGGGQRIKFVARTGGSGRGFPGHKIVLDEAFNLPTKAVEALVPTLSAAPDAQVWFTSSAPLETEESATLRRICRAGRKGAPLLAYIEYSADPTAYRAATTDAELAAAIDAPEALRQANPGLHIRISEEFVRSVERSSMTIEGYARERLGIWEDDSDEGDNWPIPASAWLACCDPHSTLGAPLAWAVDASPNGQSAAVAVSDGRHIEVIEHRGGTAWVPSVLVELQERWRLGAVHIDPKPPAGVLLPGIEAAGLSVQEVTAQEHAQACADLYQAATAGTLRHRGQLPLNAALAGAATRQSGDAWLWSRRNSSVDISPLVAVTLARWAAEHGGSSSYEGRGMRTL